MKNLSGVCMYVSAGNMKMQVSVQSRNHTNDDLIKTFNFCFKGPHCRSRLDCKEKHSRLLKTQPYLSLCILFLRNL